MKKLSIIAIAAAALALAACSQERNIVPADSGVTTVTATHFAAGTRSFIEADLSGETPAYEILWDAPDKILVGYAGAVATFTSTNTEPAAEATFTGKLPEGSGLLYGIYPAKSGNKVNSDGSFSIAFKAEQEAIPGSYDPESFPAVAESRSKDLSFQNVCSLLALTVEDEGITKITLKGNGGACFYGGTFTVVTDSGEPEVDDFTEDVYEITLTADGTFDPEETYYMSVPPVTFADGVVFTLTFEDGTTADVVLANEVTAERSKVHQVTLIGEDPYNGYEYVDLGLPSGLKWATCNVGAESPEKYGDYFAWGETETKSEYRWSTYIFAYDTDPITGMLGDGSLSKYLTKDYWGTPDDKTVLDPEDDAAYVNWGGAWRMPEISDWEELRNNCTLTWTDSYNGTNARGMIVTSNIAGYTDNSIFLPAQGIWDEGLRYRVGYRGYYWSSSLDQDFPTGARRAWFDSEEFTMEHNLERNIGAAVRPVAN